VPYPPGFPILVPGQQVSPEILEFMRRLDVKEVHGYRAELGLALFRPEVLDLAQTGEAAMPDLAEETRPALH
jgi:arginine decarboxylase